MRRYVTRFICLLTVAALITPASMGRGVSAHSTLQPRSSFTGENPPLLQIMRKLSADDDSGNTPEFAKIFESVSKGLKDNPYAIVASDASRRRRDKDMSREPGNPSLSYSQSIYAIAQEQYSEAIEHYRTYFKLLHENPHYQEVSIAPFRMGLKRIYKLIQDNTNPEITPNITSLDLEFLFVQLLRELKEMGKGWAIEGAFEGLPEGLSQGKIYEHIFQARGENLGLLGRWPELRILGANEEERENNVHQLATVILFYLYGKNDIDHFGKEEQRIFITSHQHDPETHYNVGFGFGLPVWLGRACRTSPLPEDSSLIDMFLNLYGPNLKGIGMQQANLNGLNLQGANMEGANLQGAIMWMTYLDNVNLEGANLQGAVLHSLAPSTRLKGANLQGVHLDEASLVGINLSGINLSNADLRRAELQKADLSGANLEGANLYSAKLEGAIFEASDLKDVRILRSQLIQYADLFTEEQIAVMETIEDVSPPSNAVEADL